MLQQLNIQDELDLDVELTTNLTLLLCQYELTINLFDLLIQQEQVTLSR